MDALKRVGLEIECPFSFYYPDLYIKYFSEPYAYTTFGDKNREALDEDLKIREIKLYDKLYKFSKEHGLTRGGDRYWEFVFPPQSDLDKHADIIQKLVEENLLPLETSLSIHLTVGGLTKNQAYSVLFFLEKKYLTSDRVKEAYRKGYISGWGLKNKTGLLQKKSDDLQLDSVAYEMRTLKIQMKDARPLLNYLKQLLDSPTVETDARAEMTRMGLPWAAWNESDFLKFVEKSKD